MFPELKLGILCLPLSRITVLYRAIFLDPEMHEDVECEPDDISFFG